MGIEFIEFGEFIGFGEWEDLLSHGVVSEV
jgi:hypothetical protein